MRVAVGVDAGGSGTSAVASVDRVRGDVAHTDAANATTLGAHVAARVIAQAVCDALGDATQPDALVVGAAGAGSPAIALAMRDALQERFPVAKISVGEDTRVALRAAVPAGDGAVLIAGTGSHCYGEFGDLVVRAGGYGPLIDDGGSGFVMGAAAIKQLACAYDGRGPHDELTRSIEQRLATSNGRDLTEWLGGQTSQIRAIASVAPLVLAAAQNGERSATKIVQTAAADLASIVRAVVRQAPSQAELPLVFAGGLLQDNSLLTFLLEQRIANDFSYVHIERNPPDPHYGALSLAEQMLTNVSS